MNDTASAQTGWTARRAGVADAPAIRALFCRSFTATFGLLYPAQTLADFLEGCSTQRFAADLALPDTACLLAERDGRLIGYCMLGDYDLQPVGDESWWVLRMLYLDEEAKGTGIAQALMDWAIGEARERRYGALYLTVYIDNHRARRFYDRNGWVEVGRYAFAVGDQVDDDRIMKYIL